MQLQQNSISKNYLKAINCPLCTQNKCADFKNSKSLPHLTYLHNWEIDLGTLSKRRFYSSRVKYALNLKMVGNKKSYISTIDAHNFFK